MKSGTKPQGPYREYPTDKVSFCDFFANMQTETDARLEEKRKQLRAIQERENNRTKKVYDGINYEARRKSRDGEQISISVKRVSDKVHMEIIGVIRGIDTQLYLQSTIKGIRTLVRAEVMNLRLDRIQAQYFSWLCNLETPAVPFIAAAWLNSMAPQNNS